jgi:hypothetical protein
MVNGTITSYLYDIRGGDNRRCKSQGATAIARARIQRNNAY